MIARYWGEICTAVSVYWTFVRTAFLTMLAYRLRYFTGILTYLLLSSVHFFIWQAVYAGRADTELYGFSLAQMITYISVGWISRSFYFSNIDDEINNLVSSGQISTYLLRPVNFQLMLIARAIGESLFRITFFSTPIAVVLLFLFPILLPAGVGDWLLFCYSTFVGFFILVQFNFLIGLLAFYFKSIDGVMRAKYYLVQLLSGLLLPIEFFPGWAQQILNMLPFKMIASVPLNFYLGKIPAVAVPGVIFGQLLWLLLLYLIGRACWQSAFSRLTLQGG